MTEDHADEGSTNPTPDSKERFREALERKKAGQHRSADGDSRSGAVRGSETVGPVQRQFRRKSG